jgi:hypothetical protein
LDSSIKNDVSSEIIKNLKDSISAPAAVEVTSRTYPEMV